MLRWRADYGPYAVPISFLAVDSVAAEPRVLLLLGGHGDAVRAHGHCVVLDLAEVAPLIKG